VVSDALIGLVRTIIPALVGACLAWLIAAQFSHDPELSIALMVMCTALYYGVVTMLERRLSPRIGWLLGYPSVPFYRYKGDPDAL
jgi:hypothetical protein